MAGKSPNILITNDDGIYSEGILALKKALEKVGTVNVIAPERPRSASGHSITLHKPLRVNKVRLADGSEGYAASGTPSDCVMLGVLDVFKGKVDMVFSGINWGPNLGLDNTYSGTVSAALEAAIVGVPGVAVSVTTYGEGVQYDAAADFAAFLAPVLMEKKIPADVFLNVNVPNVASEEIRGVEITRQGLHRYAGRVEKRSDPKGRTYYWLGGDIVINKQDEGSDVCAVANNRISVTPLHLDLTGRREMDALRSWGLAKYMESSIRG